jgi:Rieske Fe-S protein
MTIASNPSRRTVLAGVGTGAGLLALAACSSGNGNANGTDGNGTDPAVVPAGTDLVAASDVPVGGALAVTIGEAPILVTQPAEGDIRAFSAVCTHQGCPVGVGEGELACPCHGSRFDLETAAVLGGPATRPLPSLAVSVQDGRVVTT